MLDFNTSANYFFDQLAKEDDLTQDLNPNHPQNKELLLTSIALNSLEPQVATELLLENFAVNRSFSKEAIAYLKDLTMTEDGRAQAIEILEKIQSIAQASILTEDPDSTLVASSLSENIHILKFYLSSELNDIERAKECITHIIHLKSESLSPIKKNQFIKEIVAKFKADAKFPDFVKFILKQDFSCCGGDNTKLELLYVSQFDCLLLEAFDKSADPELIELFLGLDIEPEKKEKVLLEPKKITKGNLLILAARYKKYEIVKTILKFLIIRGNKENLDVARKEIFKSLSSCLWVIAENADVNLLDIFTSCLSDADKVSLFFAEDAVKRNFFHLAAAYGNSDVFFQAIAQLKDDEKIRCYTAWNSRGNCLLHYAFKGGCWDLVEDFLNLPDNRISSQAKKNFLISANSQNLKLWQIAVQSNHYRLIGKLLDLPAELLSDELKYELLLDKELVDRNALDKSIEEVVFLKQSILMPLKEVLFNQFRALSDRHGLDRQKFNAIKRKLANQAIQFYMFLIPALLRHCEPNSITENRLNERVREERELFLEDFLNLYPLDDIEDFNNQIADINSSIIREITAIKNPSLKQKCLKAYFNSRYDFSEQTSWENFLGSLDKAKINNRNSLYLPMLYIIFKPLFEKKEQGANADLKLDFQNILSLLSHKKFSDVNRKSQMFDFLDSLAKADLKPLGISAHEFCLRAFRPALESLGQESEKSRLRNLENRKKKKNAKNSNTESINTQEESKQEESIPRSRFSINQETDLKDFLNSLGAFRVYCKASFRNGDEEYSTEALSIICDHTKDFLQSQNDYFEIYPYLGKYLLDTLSQKESFMSFIKELSDTFKQEFVNTFFSEKEEYSAAFFNYFHTHIDIDDLGELIACIITGRFETQRFSSPHLEILETIHPGIIEKWRNINFSMPLSIPLNSEDCNIEIVGDWRTLFLIGTVVAKSCQNIWNTKMNKHLLGLLLGGENLALVVKSPTKGVVARSILHLFEAVNDDKEKREVVLMSDAIYQKQGWELDEKHLKDLGIAVDKIAAELGIHKVGENDTGKEVILYALSNKTQPYLKDNLNPLNSSEEEEEQNPEEAAKLSLLDSSVLKYMFTINLKKLLG